VDADLRRLLERATSIVTDHRLTVLRIAERLIAQRTIDADTINDVVGRIAGSRRVEEAKTRLSVDAF
jgi:ATP-dependent Zn protease